MNMAMFGGALTGIGESLHERNLMQMQQQADIRKSMSGQLLEMMKNPNLMQEGYNRLAQASMEILDTKSDPQKVMGKALYDLHNMHIQGPMPGMYPQTVTGAPAAPTTFPQTITPPTSETVTAGGRTFPGSTGEPVTVPRAFPGFPAMTETIPPPNAPPDFTRSAYRTPEETARITAEAAGEKTSAEERAKLAATYGDPNWVNTMITMKRLEQRPEAFAPGSHVLIPDANSPTGWTQISGGQRIKPHEEQIDNAGVLSVLSKNGLLGKQKFDENVPYLQQIPPELQADAVAEGERLRKTQDPVLEAIRIQNAAGLEQQRKQLEADRAQKMFEFSQTKGPEAIRKAAEWVHQDPNAMASVPADIRAAVVGYMTDQKWRVPRALNSTQQDRQDNANQTLWRIERVRQIAAANPDLIGVISGALAKGQAATGIQMFPGNPQKAAAAEELISGLGFLQMAEAKAILGSRPNFQWAKKFEEITANPGQQPAVFKGALDSQEAHAHMILKGIDQLQYGNQREEAPKAPPTGITIRRINGVDYEVDANGTVLRRH